MYTIVINKVIMTSQLVKQEKSTKGYSIKDTDTPELIIHILYETMFNIGIE